MCKAKSPWVEMGALTLLALAAVVFFATGTVAFGDDDDLGTMADEADVIFDPMRLHRIEVTMDPNDLAGMRSGDIRDYRIADAVIVDGIRRDQVGIRTHAVRLPEDPSFRTHPTLEFDFSLVDENQTLLGLRLLSIRSWSTDDRSLLVQQLGMRLMAEFGLPAPRVAHAKVFINGEYIGPYVMEERVRLNGVVPRFQPLGGNLYTIQNTSNSGERLPFYDGFAFARRNPDDPASYVIGSGGYPFQGRGGPNPDGSDLLRVIRALNRPTSSQARAEVGPWLDVKDLIDDLVVDMSLANSDGLMAVDNNTPPLRFENNTYLYHNPATDRFNIFPDDLKGSLDAYDPRATTRDLLDGWDTFSLTRWLLEEPDLLDFYFQRVRTFITTQGDCTGRFTPQCIIPRIDQMAAVVRPAVAEDTRKPVTMEWWDRRVEGLRQFVQNRWNNLRSQLGIAQ